jgi:hypothetical protein
LYESNLPEYTKTFIFFEAILAQVVTFAFGAEFPRFFSAEHRALLNSRSTNPDAYTLLSSSRMSKDDKASVAAAQLLIDDEPDDWCVATPRGPK